MDGQKSLYSCGFSPFRASFPLDRCRGLACNIVHDPVDVGHLVDDADAHPVQHLVGDAGPVGGHEVCGGDGPQGQGVVVGPAVAHDANGAHVGQHGKVLAHGALQMGLGDLVPEDEVRLAQGVQLLLGDLADHPDGKARTREGLAHDQILRQAQLPAQLADLVLEQHPQGLDDLLEVHVVRQAAHVVVALDDGGIAGAGLDHVGIDGALDQVVHLPDLLGLRLKDPDELLTDDLPLPLRLGDAGQLAQEQLLGIGPDEVDVPLLEGGLHLVALVQAHEAVVHEHAGQLAAHGLGHQGRRHRGVHAAGQGQQHLAVPDLLPDLADGGLLVVAHGPVARRAADLVQEVADHVGAVLCVVDLRVVLDAVEAPALVADGHIGAGVGVGHQREALGDPLHIVAVAHPGDALGGQALEELAGCIEVRLGLAVLPGGVVLGLGDPAAQVVGHQLAAVADAQDGHAPGEDGRVHLGGLGIIHAVGAAGEDDADGVHGADLVQRGGVGLHLAVDAALPDPAGDELVVLSAEIQHDDSLVRQGDSSFV